MAGSVKAADIASLLFAHLAALPGTPKLPVAHPNVAFSPPGDGKFLTTSFMPNRIEAGMIRFEDENARTGLLQIGVYWPLNNGVSAPQRVADSVLTHFARGTVIAGDGFAVRVIEDPWSSTLITESSRAMIPVTVPWSAY